MTWGISPWGADAWGTAAAEEAATGPLYTAPTLNSSKAYVVNLDSGEPHYYEKSPSTAANMQSTVKLMTALVVMEEFGTKALLEAEDVTIISADRTAGGTGANLQDGDVWTLWTLLLDALIPSSNDACLAMARYIGDKMYADAGDTGTQGVTRFVEAMNAKASALGMTNTTYVVPHGLSTNSTTAEDMGKLALAADLVLANQDILDAMYYRQTTITIDRSGGQDLTIEKADGGENVPGYIMGKNGLGSQAHLWTVSNLPNGDRLFIMTSGASNYRSSDADHINLYRQLVQTDASGTLGTAANEATPAWVAGQAGVNLLAFDDTGMYQDDGTSTAADADTDPVRRWYPVTEVGVSGNYLRADSAGERPERDAAGKIDWNTGTNAELHLGSTGFGDTTFFADSGDAFTILCNTEGGVTAGTVFARAGTGNTDLRFYYTTQFAHQITIRGTTQDPDVGALNSTSADGGGQEGVHGLMWDGTEASALAGGISLPGEVTAGTDSESTNNLSFGNNGGTDAWEGLQGRTILVDGALSKTQLRQLHAWCMGVTLDQTLVGIVDAGAPDLTTGVEFDGSTDYYSRSSDLTGAANGKNWYFAALIKVDGGDGTQRILFDGSDAGSADGRAIVGLNTSNQIQFAFRQLATGFNAVDLVSSAITAGSGWKAVLASGNGTTSHLYVNDVSDQTVNTLSDVALDLTHTDWVVGGAYSGAVLWDGCAVEVAYGAEYIDFSVEANRRGFFDAAGNPVPKGSDGSTPTGTAPLVYLSGGVSQFADNFGSGGAFTENGTPADCPIPVFVSADPVSHGQPVDLASGSTASVASPLDLLEGHGLDTAAAAFAAIALPLDVVTGHLLEQAAASFGGAASAQGIEHAHALAAASAAASGVAAPVAVVQGHLLNTAAASFSGVVVVDAVAHALSLDQTSLTTGDALSALAVVHAHSVEAPSLTFAGVVSPAGLQHGHAVDAAAASSSVAAMPGDVFHTHGVSIAVGQFIPGVAPVAVTHGHLLDQVDAVFGGAVSPAQILHGHLLDAAGAVDPALIVLPEDGRMVLVSPATRVVRVM